MTWRSGWSSLPITGLSPARASRVLLLEGGSCETSLVRSRRTAVRD